MQEDTSQIEGKNSDVTKTSNPMEAERLDREEISCHDGFGNSRNFWKFPEQNPNSQNRRSYRR